MCDVANVTANISDCMDLRAYAIRIKFREQQGRVSQPQTQTTHTAMLQFTHCIKGLTDDAAVAQPTAQCLSATHRIIRAVSQNYVFANLITRVQQHRKHYHPGIVFHPTPPSSPLQH